ncbi:hypothetical protein A2480_03555 [Candidatus Uhrbacteria bacterium RIFOXYC2_FULL_47_19]|uniref:Peptidase C39-like domain-containing protein n=1 Tax=Candidatus Uhrbacteria bacterium RIFOXYC2_FULL_47_19 TaxID=1802424 RepID=A0A1F7WBY3_9BACT|nr:MAG: hypothetical protein A2480_03555 [Candidatus Uhrbacteria bacterium RIFOXYC2_FULL_47_19]HCC21834.1 hypothetical protein [Candidatus Uhrbacteria bacterium]
MPIKKTKTPIIILIIAGLIVIAAGGAYVFRGSLIDAYRSWQRGPIPEPVSRIEFEQPTSIDVLNEDKTDEQKSDDLTTNSELDTNISEINSAKLDDAGDEEQTEPEPEPEPLEEVIETKETPTTRPSSINLRVPFMIQAPTANWDNLHGEACEEATAIMLAAYYTDEAKITTSEAEERIMDAVAWQDLAFGYYLDTTSEETARMIREHFGLASAEAIPIDSLDDILSMVAAGKPVIVPAYGKALGNQNFRNSGPLYHMLLIKGYDGDRIITNDPGTRRGADYVYDADVLWNAIHDWNGGDVPHGEKMMIVVEN